MKPDRTELADAAARERIREDLDATLVVEAAAGTGKTTELVARVVALLREGRATLSRLIAVTFTDKAAGEMKLRLRTELERERSALAASDPRLARLDAALAELELARIGTIHSLCADLLRERPIEACVDPLFEVAAGDEEARLFDQAFDTWFQTALSDPPEGVRRVLRRRKRGRGGGGPRRALRAAGLSLLQHRDFDTPWRRDPFDREHAIDRTIDALRGLAALAGLAERENDYLAQNLAHVARFVEELGRREAVRARDYDGLEPGLAELARHRSWNWKGGGTWFARGIPRGDVLAQRDAAKAELDALVARLDADLAACLFAELRPLVERYEELKARAGKLDFLDLLVRARDLVRDDRAVRAELQERISHLLVDEFQDTDPLQAELLLLLAADDPDLSDYRRARPMPGKLFVVGDPKQSIYRFRRADVALYESIKRLLVERGASVVHLTTSFRSAPSIQQAVNAAFAPRMQGGGTQAEYVPLESFRPETASQPSIVALPVPRPYGDYGSVAQFRVAESVPEAVGAFIAFVLRESGWKVTDRERPTELVPVAARHVCILFKRFSSFDEDITRPYVRALETRSIPHVLVGGRSYHDREEVIAVRNALAALEWPDDELSVYATLRGPFFALSDAALLAYRSTFGSIHPLRRIDPAPVDPELADVHAALAILARLGAGRNRRPVSATIASLLEATRAHAGIAIWPMGEQALANVLRVMDLARKFEARGATSFRAFVERLERDADEGEVGEAPIVEEGTDGVRIMTVHKAKGLEFPIVILADPGAPHTHQNPSRFVDPERRICALPLAGCTPVELLEQKASLLERDLEEATRLTYVAATRARDVLVVPAVGDEPLSGWVDVLHPALYPNRATRRLARPAPGCPPFGDDSVLERPARVPFGAEASVAPGLHAPEAGEHAVVWWDPRALELDVPRDVGRRQQRLLKADDAGNASRSGIEAHQKWQEARHALIERGAAASLVVVTPTALAAAAAPAPPPAIAIERTNAPRERRPHGKRFGTLVHAVLAAVDLGAAREAVERAAATQAKLVGASDDEVAAAVLAVLAALEHPLLRRAAASERAGACRRECPIVWRRDDGVLVEGVLDLAFRDVDDGTWVVVDFKTDAQLGEREATYAVQLEAYVGAVTRATNESARGVLLCV